MKVAVLALVVLMVGTAIGFGLAASPPRRAAPPPPTFRLNVRTDPATARVDLDGRPVGAGALTLVLPRDGRSHALHVYADGYEPQVLSFTDVAPSERVTLRPRVVPPPPVPMVVRTPIVGEPVAPPAVTTRRQPQTESGHRRPRPVVGSNQGALATPAAVAPPPPPTGGNCPNGQCVF